MAKYDGIFAKFYARRCEWYSSTPEWLVLGIAFVVFLILILVP